MGKRAAVAAPPRAASAGAVVSITDAVVHARQEIPTELRDDDAVTAESRTYERAFLPGSAFSFPVRPTPRANGDAGVAVVKVGVGCRLRLTTASLFKVDGDGDPDASVELLFNSSDNHDLLTLCNFCPQSSALTMTGLGVDVCGPRTVQLSVRAGRKGRASVHLFGSVERDAFGGSCSPLESSPGRSPREQEASASLRGLEESLSGDENHGNGDGSIVESGGDKKRKAGADDSVGITAVHDGEATRQTSAQVEQKKGNHKEEDTDAPLPPTQPLTKKQRRKLAKLKAKELAETVAKQNGHHSIEPETAKEEKSTIKSKKTADATPLTKERRLPGGLLIRDTLLGTGPTVKPGRKVSILYEGSLHPSGHVFDKNLNRNRPLTFRQGTGEVIKGLERGLDGMKVGGERIVTIPPALGYGKKGSGPEVPGNATLVFEVQLVGVGNR